MSSFSEARNQLAFIFQKNQVLQKQKEVLQCFQQYPSLAAERFETHEGGHATSSMMPMSLIISEYDLSQVDIQFLKEIYYQYPTVLKEPQGKNEELPIHFACKKCSKMPPELIQFLAETYPEGLSFVSKYNNLPVEYVLSSLRFGSMDRKLDILRLLLKLYPESILKKTQIRCYDLNMLELAFNQGYRVEVMKCILEYCPKHILEKAILYGSDMTMEKIQQFVQPLLPHLTLLDCQPYAWKSDAFLEILRLVRSNTSITKLALSFPFRAIMRDRNLQRALQSLLEDNTTLKCLSLVHNKGNTLLTRDSDGGTEDNDQVLVQSLVNGLKHNNTLTELRLNNFQWNGASAEHTQQADTSLLELLVYAPNTLKLGGCRICGNLSNPPANFPGTESRLRHFEMLGEGRDCYIQRESIRDLYAFLSHILYLETVSIRCRHSYGTEGSVDTTDALIGILQQTNVHKIICQAPIQIEPFCRALENNATLKQLEIIGETNLPEEQFAALLALLRQNTTLEAVHFPGLQGSKHFIKINHLARLNKFGRKRVRHPAMNLAVLVVLLVAVKKDESQPLKTEEDRCDVLYGLLRECPSLWSGSLETEEKVVFRILME